MNAPARGAGPGNPLIVALDTASAQTLTRLATQVGPHVGAVKVGLQAYTALGPAAVTSVRHTAPVFVDLKLHDIPNTVAGAAAAAADLGVALLTVHAAGGPQMIAAAVKAAPATAVLAVTVLTSLDDSELAAVGQPPASQQVPRLAALAADAGAAGVVCAATDVATVRATVGRDLLVVVPGIRPAGSAPDDQARTASPRQAVAAGASHLVVGRPVTRADDPAAACRALLAEL